MNIFIDAETGTYGVADELYVLHVNDGAEIGDILDVLSEKELGMLARAFGVKAIDFLY